MALTFTDECVGCPPEIGCLGISCKYRNVPHLVCDKCKRETDALYVHGTGQLCEQCLLSKESMEIDDIDDIDEDNILEQFERIDYYNLPEPEEPDYDDWED